VLLPSIKQTSATYTDNTTVESRVNISNVAPIVTVDYFYNNQSNPNDNIALTEGGTTLVFCNGTIVDNNGWWDVGNLGYVNVSIYDKDYPTGAPDNNYRYLNGSCYREQINATAIFASCTINMWFYANNDTWYCNMTAVDGGGEVGSGTKSNTVLPLYALDVNTTLIDYGELAPGDSSPNDVVVGITNFGNMDINVSVEGYAKTRGDGLAMNCTIGNISVEYEKYALQPGQPVSSMTNLTSSPLPGGIEGLTILQNTDDNGNSTNSTYWKLEVPIGMGRGTCNGTVLFAAVY